MGNMQKIMTFLRSQWLIHSMLQFFLIIGLGLHFGLAPSFEGTIQALWQFLPISVLEQYGWASLYYIHQQPPFLSVLLITILETVGRGSLEGSLRLIMLAVLFANILVINRITVALGFNLLVSWVFIFFPAFWLYHTWFYEPTFTLFFTNCVFLGLILKPSKHTFLLVAFGFVGLTLTHGSFHPLVILLILGLSWFLLFRNIARGRTLLIAVALATIPITFVLKNVYLVGSPSLSSWAGCNLHQKFMHIGKGFEYMPNEVTAAPSILGSTHFSDGKRLNTNNIDFAKHCNENLRLIISKIKSPGEFSGYVTRVMETLRNNESSLSLEYRGAGFSPSHWGSLAPRIDWLITFKPYYGPILFAIALFGPALTLLALVGQPLLKPMAILALIYYFGLSVAHLANGWEQMRMAYRSSFFIYICTLLFAQTLIHRAVRRS